MRNALRWLVQRLYGALDNIIATLILAGLAYLVAALAGLLPPLVIPGPFRIPLVIAVSTVLPVLILVVIIVRRSQTKAAITPLKLREPSRPLDFERLGLSQYIEPDPQLVDNTHTFSLIHQTYSVDGYDGTFILRYQGKNATRRMSRCFRDSVVGDSAADVPLMAIKVVDRQRNALLTWKLLKNDPYEKLIEINFPRPLGFGDEFDIEFSCRWPGTFTRREDYAFYPLHYYRRGVKKLVGELILSAAPTYVEGIRFDGKKALLEPVQPQIQNTGGKSVVTWQIENPKYIYVLQYGRQDI